MRNDTMTATSRTTSTTVKTLGQRLRRGAPPDPEGSVEGGCRITPEVVMVSAKSSSQPATDPPVTGLTTGTTTAGLTSEIQQARRRAIVAGRTGDRESATALLDHHEPAVRQAALGALAADGHLDTRLIVEALGDDGWTVRRRACELAGRLAISAGGEDRDGDEPGDDAP